jgi:Matrixin
MLLHRAAAFSAFAAMVCGAREVRAYRTGSEKSELAGTAKVRWATSLIPYTLQTQTPPGLSFEEVQQLAQKALGAWSAPACSGVVFSNALNTSDPAKPGDGVNTIQWVFSNWQERGFDPKAPGITDTQYAKNEQGTWEIVEADTYLNGEYHQWIGTGAREGYVDLESVLVHESGHMLGLLHPCEPGGAEGAPDCAAHPEMAAETMYPFYDAGQNTLAADDEAGLCFLYPACSAGGPCDDHPNDVTTHDDGALAAGRAVDGDPCGTGRQCASGLCAEAGHCVSPCTEDTDCHGGIACSVSGSGGLGRCGEGRLPLGAACRSPNECLGGACIGDSDAAKTLCTRACGEDAPCPSGWECGEVDKTPVCWPSDPVANGSCAIGMRTRPGRDRRGRSIAGCLIAASAWALRRRRSVERPERRSSSRSIVFENCKSCGTTSRC